MFNSKVQVKKVDVKKSRTGIYIDADNIKIRSNGTSAETVVEVNGKSFPGVQRIVIDIDAKKNLADIMLEIIPLKALKRKDKK
jgi:imidazole glycerol phosphate synthase subunit HisF